MKNYKKGGKVEENGPAILHEGETVIRAHGVPKEKMSASYDEYWHEVRPSGAADAGTDNHGHVKPATHGHSYPGRSYAPKGTQTGHKAPEQNEVVPCLDMDTIEEVNQ
jgi:hypothetical protein